MGRCIGVAVSLLLIITSLSAQQEDGETYLVLIEVEDVQQQDSLVDMDLRVYALYDDIAVAEISGEQHEILWELGVRLTVVDSLPQTEGYFLLSVPESALSDVKEQAAVLDYRKGTAFLRASPFQAEKAARFGFGLTQIPQQPIPWGIKEVRYRSRPTTGVEEAFLHSIVSNVSQSEITATIQRLQDFRTRYSCTDSCQAAAAYLYGRLASFGLSVSYDLYQYNEPPCIGQTWRNVVAVHPGLTDSSQIYILCGHYDSINRHEDPWIIAPGADDNASGTAAVVEAARVLSEYDFHSSLYFICFSGEEQGLIGSYHYAQWAHDQGLDIRGVVNLDMIAYVDDPPNDTWDVNIYGDSQSYDLALMMADMVEQHTTAIPFTIHTGTPIYGSDHYPFALEDYRAIFGIDAQLWGSPDWNPYYHSSGDTLGTLNMPYATEVIKASVATMANLAGAIGAGDSHRPTMETIVESQGQLYCRAPIFSNFGFDDDTALDDGWYQVNSYTASWIALFTNVSGTSWDNNGWTMQEFSTLPDGSHTIYFMASDDAGNVEGESGEWSWQFYKDTTPPEIPIISSPTHPDESKWHSIVDVTFTWTEPYDLSGVIGYSYVLDQNLGTVPDEIRDGLERSAIYSGFPDGTYSFHCRAGDNVFLWGQAGHFTIRIDTESPPAPLGLSVDPSDWTNNSMFTVYWTDPEDLSGIAGAYYKLGSPPVSKDDGTLTPDHPLTFSGSVEGSQPLYVWLKDEAGNTDHRNVGLVSINFDSTAPDQGMICIAGGADTTTSLIVPLDCLYAFDEVSGMGPGALMQFSNDGQSWTAAEPFDTSRADWDLSTYGGTHESGWKRVFVKYRDVAGTWSESFSDDIVCSLPLEILTQILPKGVVGFEYNHSLTATGGWPPYSWRLASGSLPSGFFIDLTGTISGLPDSAGVHFFEVTVEDTAGNTLPAQFSIEIEAPRSGDVNGDGQIDVLDVILAVNIILELMDPTSAQFKGADCNGDGIVNIVDSICIVTLVLESGYTGSSQFLSGYKEQ